MVLGSLCFPHSEARPYVPFLSESNVSVSDPGIVLGNQGLVLFSAVSEHNTHAIEEESRLMILENEETNGFNFLVHHLERVR